MRYNIRREREKPLPVLKCIPLETPYLKQKGELTFMINLPSILKTIQNLFQKGFVDTRKLDAALSDLRLNTRMSAQELEKFYHLSNDLAKELGVSTEAILR